MTSPQYWMTLWINNFCCSLGPCRETQKNNEINGQQYLSKVQSTPKNIFFLVVELLSSFHHIYQSKNTKSLDRRMSTSWSLVWWPGSRKFWKNWRAPMAILPERSTTIFGVRCIQKISKNIKNWTSLLFLALKSLTSKKSAWGRDQLSFHLLFRSRRWGRRREREKVRCQLWDRDVSDCHNHSFQLFASNSMCRWVHETWVAVPLILGCSQRSFLKQLYCGKRFKYI